MTETKCSSCKKKDSVYSCGICEESLCKNCSLFLDDKTFSFRDDLPEELKHSHYCQVCYNETVDPAITEYQAQIKEAEQVFIFFATGKRKVPTLKKALRTVEVNNCTDRDETILRLGFIAVRGGYNAVIETELKCVKKRDHGWHKSMWSGEGRPALVDGPRMQLEYERAEGKGTWD